MSGPTILLDVPIRFDVGDTVTHAPMVDTLIGGVATRLILDTGSTDHVLTIDVVQAAGLPHEPGEPGTDHAGSQVDSWFVGEVGARIGELDVALHGVVAITGPAPFAGWGVGGFLSPQHLHPSAVAVIDLVGDRLILLDGGDDAAVRDWLRARHPDLAMLELERDPAEPTPVVQAAIRPFPPVATMLNTGGRGTEFATAAVPGLATMPDDAPGKGVGGGPVVGAVAGPQTLVVGDVDMSIPRLLVRPAIDTMLGLVGQDILRGTVLVVGADWAGPVRWLVPPAG